MLTNRAYLGGKAQEALVKGLEISEEITGAIVADAIRTMNAKIALDPSTAQGWVLVDYPKTRAQAALLERELSGYEEPKAQKLGNLKRNQNSAKPNQRTLIAQPANGEQSAASMAESIIDAVFVLDVENAVAIRRAVGRRQDPITGRVFHLEFDPPSAEEPGLVERLVPLDSENDNDNQLQEHLVAYEEEHAGVKSWFTKFGNMHFVDANSTKDDTLTSVELVVSQVIEERKSKLASRPQSVANSTDAKPSSTDFAADAAKPTAERPSSPTTTASDASAQKTPAGTASTPTLTRASRSASTSKPNSARIKRLNITRSAFAGLPTPGITKELATILYNSMSQFIIGGCDCLA